MKIFEYIYYNLYIFYSKKENTDSGPWMVICLIQIFIFMTCIYLPLGLYFGKAEMKENKFWTRPALIIFAVALMHFNHFYFQNKFETLKERYKDEPESIRKRNTVLIYLSLLGLFIIFFGAILIRDGGFKKTH